MCIPEQTKGRLSSTMGVIGAEMYQALLIAHVPEDVAQAAAAEVAKSQDVASKSDVLESGVHLQAEMDKRFAELRAEMDKRFAELRSEMDNRFAEVEKSLAILKFAVFSGESISIALLIKLVFFP